MLKPIFLNQKCPGEYDDIPTVTKTKKPKVPPGFESRTLEVIGSLNRG